MKQPESNKFIQKFRTKDADELHEYLENPTQYQPEAVEAAKWLLKVKEIKPEAENNRDTKAKTETKISFSREHNEQGAVQPKLKEKAFFKNKLLYYLACLFSLIYSLVLLISSFYTSSIFVYIWTAIYSFSFLILISKHKNTVLYLKILAALALSNLAAQYISYFYNNFYYSFIEELLFLLKEDYRTILFTLIIMVSADKLVENRFVEKQQ